jgi:hypothetical protein
MGHTESHVAERKLLRIEQRAPAADVQVRLRERDQRLASDNRSLGQRLLGDPPPAQSALRQRRPVDIIIEQLIDRLRRRSRKRGT